MRFNDFIDPGGSQGPPAYRAGRGCPGIDGDYNMIFTRYIGGKIFVSDWKFFGAEEKFENVIRECVSEALTNTFEKNNGSVEFHVQWLDESEGPEDDYKEVDTVDVLLPFDEDGTSRLRFTLTELIDGFIHLMPEIDNKNTPKRLSEKLRWLADRIDKHNE